MYLDITRFVTEADPSEYSASRAERGANAGTETWQAANEAAKDEPLLTTQEAIETVRDWFGEFGAWDDDERAAWSPAEVNALLIQYISGDMREAPEGDGPGSIDWDAYEAGQADGTYASNLFRTDDGRVFIYIGS